MDLLEQALLFVISLIANLLSALAGGGAGLIQLPALIFLGLPFPVALATHKVATVALGLGATLRHLKNHSLQRRFALFFLGFGLPGVMLGATLVLYIPEIIATFSLGLLTISLGVYSHLQKKLGQHQHLKNQQGSPFLVGCLVLFLLGILNGSLTSGTGLFVTLWLIYWFGFDYTRAVAYTMVLVGLFWNFTGAVTLGLHGQIHWIWVPALLMGSFLGGYAGAHIGLNKGNRLIKTVFEICAVISGFALIIKTL